MHVKVDEDLPKSVQEQGLQGTKDSALWQVVQQKGCFFVTADPPGTLVQEQGLQGTKDSALWQVVQQKGCFFVTADKGFGDVRLYPPGTHHGILLLRPDVEGIASYTELLRSVLSTVRLQDLVGLLAVATPRGLRVRRAT
jgi:hypothetical protein